MFVSILTNSYVNKIIVMNPESKDLNICSFFCISAHLQCTDQGYVAVVSGDFS